MRDYKTLTGKKYLKMQGTKICNVFPAAVLLKAWN